MVDKSRQNKSRTGLGPGSLLRQSRTDLKLTVEQVARKLNLSAKHINALEEDDYEKLSGPTYIRGYLRSYSHLLGLSPQGVLESFNELPAASRPVNLDAPALARQISSNDHAIKWASVVVIGIVIGLTILWWRGLEEAPTRSQVAANRPSVNTPKTTPDVAPSDVPPVVPLVPEAADVAADIPATEPESRALTTPEKPPRSDRMSAKAAPEEKNIGIPAGDRSAPPSRLVLYVLEESWADIRDGRQNKMLYEIIPAGRVITLEGVAPFHVFLGNVAGVKIEFNGRQYDPQRHKRGQVARFTLGDAPTVSP